ncbi:hypothetical protein [Shinella zoogloeoides]|uniref:hypothetical protein n=1 Tax=Shinella zoogloeoides TaxID=352475 RepID=UPI001F568A4B|nr:hypothetical protein [Shinella zoogloeoides]
MHQKSDTTLINDMADAMLRYGEGCTRDQLAMHFTQDEIDRLSERARAHANEKAVIQRRARVAARAA